MEYKIAVIKGDGVGPEIVEEGIKVLNKVGEVYNHNFTFEYVLGGGCAIDLHNDPMPDDTIEVCKKSDAVILGAVGGPKWDNISPSLRPEKGLLKLRKELNLFANIRPINVYESIKDASPLKSEIISSGVDFVVVRELTGGIYFGERGTKEDNGVTFAYDVERYSEYEIERIGRCAFEIAKKRNKKLTSVDKANVLDSSKLWRKIIDNLSIEYTDVEVNHMYVDNCAMQLIKNPSQFDVILTNNIFGDILSDEGSMIAGSIGMLPSASIRNDNFGMYEPIHGSAPDIAGKNIVNPIATILSVAMMLKHSFGLYEEASSIEHAIENTLIDGYKSEDIFYGSGKIISTQDMGDLISSYIN